MPLPRSPMTPPIPATRSPSPITIPPPSPAMTQAVTQTNSNAEAVTLFDESRPKLPWGVR